MKKIMFLIILTLGINKSFSQITNVEIITKENDTLKNVKLKINYFSRVELNYKLQEKLVILDENGKKKELFPATISSFSLEHEGRKLNYENVEDKGFALLMYSNKLKLLKYVKPSYTPVNIYMVKRPNNGKTAIMEAMGFSRLISQKVINREITDCPAIVEKVENKELKISGEEGVIELVKAYESTCF